MEKEQTFFGSGRGPLFFLLLFSYFVYNEIFWERHSQRSQLSAFLGIVLHTLTLFRCCWYSQQSQPPRSPPDWLQWISDASGPHPLLCLPDKHHPAGTDQAGSPLHCLFPVPANCPWWPEMLFSQPHLNRQRKERNRKRSWSGYHNWHRSAKYWRST